jgi:hypothetical protein
MAGPPLVAPAQAAQQLLHIARDVGIVAAGLA